MGIRVLICGGRDFDDTKLMHRTLLERDKATPFSLVIHGGAQGADKMAHQWAKKNLVPVREFKADWEKWGRSAGPIRNRAMIYEGHPDLVIAFPGGRGTADMIRQARQSGIEVVEIKHTQPP
jgi:hypothetical protein